MDSEIKPFEREEQKMKMNFQGGGGDTVYGLGLIGAWIYYIGRASTWQERGIGFLKGLVWPVFVVYELLVFLNKE